MISERAPIRKLLLAGLLGLSAVDAANIKRADDERCGTTLTLHGREEPITVTRCDQSITVSKRSSFVTARADCTAAGECTVVPGAAPVMVAGPTRLHSRIAVETAVVEKYEDWEKHERACKHRRDFPGAPFLPVLPPVPAQIQKTWDCGNGQKCFYTYNADLYPQTVYASFPTISVTTTITSIVLPTYTVALGVSVGLKPTTIVETITRTVDTTTTVSTAITLTVTSPATSSIPPLVTDVPQFDLSIRLPANFVVEKRDEASSGPQAFVHVTDDGSASISTTDFRKFSLVDGNLFATPSDGINLIQKLDSVAWKLSSSSVFAFYTDPSEDLSNEIVQYGLAELGDTSGGLSSTSVYILAVKRDPTTGAITSSQQIYMCATNNTDLDSPRLFLVKAPVPGMCESVLITASTGDGGDDGGDGSGNVSGGGGATGIGDTPVGTGNPGDNTETGTQATKTDESNPNETRSGEATETGGNGELTDVPTGTNAIETVTGTGDAGAPAVTPSVSEPPFGVCDGTKPACTTGQ